MAEAKLEGEKKIADREDEDVDVDADVDGGGDGDEVGVDENEEKKADGLRKLSKSLR